MEPESCTVPFHTAVSSGRESQGWDTGSKNKHLSVLSLWGLVGFSPFVSALEIGRGILPAWPRVGESDNLNGCPKFINFPWLP